SPAAPVPENVMVIPPTPVPDEVSVPDTVTCVPHGTAVMVLSVRVVGVGLDEELPSNTETVLLSRLATYALFVFGFTPTPTGCEPTVTVPKTELVLPSITETVLSPQLAT